MKIYYEYITCDRMDPKEFVFGESLFKALAQVSMAIEI